MTRIGVNPARGKLSNYRPARVTIAVLTYFPDLSGYFENRLEVLKLVLVSLRAHTTLPYDLMIFDNGSCQSVVDYLLELKDAGEIHYLILSPINIGKIGAFRILFNAAPGEIIAYNDDDVLFYPGWLEAHLEILDSFPHAGMVSGLPVRDATNHAHKSLDQLVNQVVPGLTVSYERHISDEWEADWAISTGRDPQTHLQATQEQLDLVLSMEKPGSQERCIAIGSANHFQFVAPKAVLLQALPGEWSGKLMGHMVELDEAVDSLGYLRLSTANRYTRHLGNALSQAVLEEAQALGLLAAHEAMPTTTSSRYRKKHWLLRIPGSRRILSTLYKRLFDILYQ
jgi:glycosyltransferase involved in cell wall biosynthesis